jgi:AcrR family transcriptional regulator
MEQLSRLEASVETKEPGTVRPGGRTAKVRTAVLAATHQELIENGYGGLNLDKVATRAGVGRTTVYRRWGNACGLLVDLTSELSDRLMRFEETGSLAGDLHAMADSLLAGLSDQAYWAVFESTIVSAASDEQARADLRSYYDRQIAAGAALVERAVERGELPEGTDCQAVVQAVAAPFYYRLLVRREPPDEALARQAAGAALAAATAGVFAA